jgi:uncharacterized protein (DUF736 family)
MNQFDNQDFEAEFDEYFPSKNKSGSGYSFEQFVEDCEGPLEDNHQSPESEDSPLFQAQIPPIDSTDMQLELGAMWNRVTKNGFRFFKGEIVDSKGQRHEITILPNGFKKKPTHPDWRIYWHKKAS